MLNEKVATYANRKAHVVFGIQCSAYEKRSRAFGFRQNTDKSGIIAMTIGLVLKTKKKMTREKKMQTNGNMYDRCMKGLSDAIEQTKTERKLKREESYLKQIRNNCNCSQIENGDGQTQK